MCKTCEVVVLLIKPIALIFLTFSLPSASLDLKVPISGRDRGLVSANGKCPLVEVGL